MTWSAWPVLALRPEPGPAREWLTRELSKREYQPSLWERVVQWLDGLFDDVAAGARAAGRPGALVSVLLLVLLAALVALVLSRLQRSGVPPAQAPEVFGDGRLSAARHRELAALAREEERWDDALVESVRAVAAGLIERGLLADEPGATAREIADRSAELFPDERDALGAAALRFEETVYGDRPAARAGAEDAAALEERIRTASPAARPAGGPVAAVPR